jgi:hypothetical protein
MAWPIRAEHLGPIGIEAGDIDGIDRLFPRPMTAVELWMIAHRDDTEAARVPTRPEKPAPYRTFFPNLQEH